MSVLNQSAFLSDMGALENALLESQTAPATRPASTLDQLTPIAYRENTLLSAGAAMRPGFVPQEGYNALAENPDLAQKYPAQLTHFAYSRSPEETEFIRSQIERERENMKMAGGAGFLLNLVGSVGAGITSPEVILPFGAAARGTTVLGKAGLAALGGTAAQSISEAGLQLSQIDRSAGESAANVVGAAVVSGLLVGAGTSLAKASSRLVNATQIERRALEIMAARDIAGESLGTRIDDFLPDNFNSLPDNARFNAAVNAAAKADPEGFGKILQQRDTISGIVAEKTIKALSKTAPAARLLAREESPHAQIMGATLARTGVIVKDAGQFGTTAEEIGGLIELDFKRTQFVAKERFQEYSVNIRGGTDEAAVDAAEFGENVIYALWNDGPLDGLPRHLREAVRKTSEDVRKTFDHIGDRIFEAGFISKRDDFKGVMRAYAPTSWNVDRIASDPEKFVRFLMGEGMSRPESVRVRDSLLDYTSKDMLGTGIYEASAFKEITLKVPRINLAREGWISTDFNHVMEGYSRMVSGRLALAEKYGTFPSQRFGTIMNDIASLGEKFGDDLVGAHREFTIMKWDLHDMRFLGALGAHLDNDSLVHASYLEKLGQQRGNLYRELQDLESSIRSLEFIGEEGAIYKPLLQELTEKRALKRSDFEALKGQIEAMRRAIYRDARTDRGWFTDNNLEHQALPPILGGRDRIPSVLRELEDEAAAIRRFESQSAVDLRFHTNKVNREFNGKKSGKTRAEAARIERKRLKAIKEIEGIRNRITGVSGLPDNPHHLAFRAERTMRKLAVVTMLNNVALSSLPDLGMHIFVNGMGRNLKGLMKFLSDADFRKRIQRDEMARGIIAAETLQGANRFTKVTEMGDPNMTRGPIEGVIDNSMNFFGKITGISWWNRNNRAWAALMVQDRIIASSRAIAEGTGTKSDALNLQSAGIGADRAKKIARQFTIWGEKESSMGTDFHFSRSDQWSDLETRQAFQAAVLGDVNRTIIQPGAGDQPLFMSMPFVRLLGAFKSFAFASNTRVLSSGMQRRDANVAMGLMAMTSIGAGVYAMRQWIKGKEVSDDPRVWAFEAVDRSGVAAIPLEANNMVESITGGYGFPALLGAGGIRSRYQDRSLADVAAGPIIGMGVKGTEVIASPFTDKGFDWDGASTFIPFQNHFAYDLILKMAGN